MADPLSIAVGVTSLLAAIGKTTYTISTFVREVRSARRDLEAVSRELASLRMSLDALHDDTQNPELAISPSMEESLLRVLNNCGETVGEIEAIVVKFLPGGLKRGVQWAMGGSGDINKLRSNLEAHKISLDITLNLLELSLLRDVKRDTSIIDRKTDNIQSNTDILLEQSTRLLQGMDMLRSQRAVESSVMETKTPIQPNYDKFPDEPPTSSNRVVKDVIDPPSDVPSLLGLIDMGYSREMALEALEKFHYDLHSTLQYLKEEHSSLSSRSSPYPKSAQIPRAPLAFSSTFEKSSQQSYLPNPTQTSHNVQPSSSTLRHSHSNQPAQRLPERTPVSLSSPSWALTQPLGSTYFVSSVTPPRSFVSSIRPGNFESSIRPRNFVSSVRPPEKFVSSVRPPQRFVSSFESPSTTIQRGPVAGSKDAEGRTFIDYMALSTVDFTKLLDPYHYPRVANQFIRKQPPQAVLLSPKPELRPTIGDYGSPNLKKLSNMGYPPGQANYALSVSGGDLIKAIHYLDPPPGDLVNHCIG